MTPSDPEVRTSIRLEPFATRHVQAVARMVDDPGVLRYTRVPNPPPPGFPNTWLARYEEGRRDGTREAFAIVDAASGEFLGLAVAPRIEREAATAELGYVVAPWARGRGVASAALAKLTEWAFAELGALRLELLISTDNEASKRVAKNCGYVYEGTMRSQYFKQGIREDSEVWSKLPTDP
jgi:RimJ/RimL family protein N-acetyltransferase